jgi:hypothetical protein
MSSPEYELTGLWKANLAAQGAKDKYKKQRQVLNQAFRDLRERAKPISMEISRDLPDFTNHDISHLDALWVLADRITGTNFRLTPTEAFVLGGAFLIHDLAMGLASYPKGLQDLKQDETWKDSISQVLSRRNGRPATKEEIEHPDKEVEQLATAELLRGLHARRAERLPTVPWQSLKSQDSFFLIDKPELRQVFGGLIGKLAASHHWPLTRVRREFEDPAVIGSAADFPPDWTIDPIKVACLLRAADAAHLDARRAPLFLRALRQPTGTSDDHWIFQAKLLQPTVSNNRLVFTSHRPGFSYAEAPAWWLCLDTLRLVDAELRQIDDLFVSLKKAYRFEARAVEGVNNLEDFARRVPTDGWEPVDTKVHVTDVASLVRSLGGKELYGDDRYIPLRELIQNGSDAIRARRLLQERPGAWGEITVRLGQDADVPWVEVEDTGVGMSTRVLKGALLDFGVSFWGSWEMREEHPGLLGKAFEAVGKYGIGFFSVFMWGDRVRVTSRRYDAALEDTKVLTFDAGLQSRPILRKADKDEQLQDSGTRVRVWCKQDLKLGEHRLEDSAKGWTKRLAWLCPALDVTLLLRYHNEDVKTSVSGSDWVSMDGYELLKRLAEFEESVDSLPIPEPGKRLTPLRDNDNHVVGRALVTPFGSRSEPTPGVVTVGGMRTSEVNGIGGIFIGKSTTASRKHALPIVPLDELGQWATSQAKDFLQVRFNRLSEQIVPVITALGGDISDFKIGDNKGNQLSISEIAQCKDLPDEILIVEPMTAYSNNRQPSPLLFFCGTTFFRILNGPGPRDVWPPLSLAHPDGRARLARTPAGVLISAIARSWEIDVDLVLAASGFDPESGRFKQDSNHRAFVGLDAWRKDQIGERIFLIQKPDSATVKAK